MVQYPMDEKHPAKEETSVKTGTRPRIGIIRQVAEYYSLPVLDLYAGSGLQPKVPVIQARYVPDGLHPNDEGHRLLAHQIAAFLTAL